jgi:hypothetical protein
MASLAATQCRMSMVPDTGMAVEGVTVQQQFLKG